MYENKTITAPVSMSDIQRAVGLFRYHDIGGLVTYGYINKWSLHKPFAYPKIAFANEAERLSAMRERNCGLTIPAFNDPFSLLAAYANEDDNHEPWVYRRPQGGTAEPFRMGDFIGYKAGPMRPFERYAVLPEEVFAIDNFHIGTDGMVDVGEGTVRLDMLQQIIDITPANMDAPYVGLVFCEEGETPTMGNSQVGTIDEHPDNIFILDGELLFDLSRANKSYVGCFFYSKYPIHDKSITSYADSKYRNAFVPCPLPVVHFRTLPSLGLEFEGTIENSIFTIVPVVNGEKDKYTVEREIASLTIDFRPEGRYRHETSEYQLEPYDASQGDWQWVYLAPGSTHRVVSANGIRPKGSAQLWSRPTHAISIDGMGGQFFATFAYVDANGRQHNYCRLCNVMLTSGGGGQIQQNHNEIS